MDIKILVENLLMLIPLVVVWLAGIILAIVNWKKMPRVALLSTIAIVLMFVLSVTSRVTSYLLYRQQLQGNLPADTVTIITTVMNIFFPFLNAVCWVLLLIAIYTGRKKDA